ncbi:hypothetical protein GCM10023321_29230 [Pseudonocardia eucalypti]|uniref:Uncharacterized protein n=1 Tax=Pseudonocardia eucalypti TaxID=648755 RepID=A0ABP9Q3Y6_9PSEU
MGGEAGGAGSGSAGISDGSGTIVHPVTVSTSPTNSVTNTARLSTDGDPNGCQTASVSR